MKSNLETLYVACGISDEALLEEILKCVDYTPMANKGILGEFMGDTAYFIEDSHVKELSKLAKRYIHWTGKEEFKEKLLEKYKSNLAGVLITNISQNSFCFFSKEVYEGQESQVRFSCVDKFGFSHHVTRANYRLLLDEAVLEGYYLESDLTMDQAWAQLQSSRQKAV